MKRILILDDNKATLQHLTDIVGGLDVEKEILSCGNIRDAYQCALEKTIDLFMVDIILDTSQPGDTSGLKFVENIRRLGHYCFTPVIFITSLEDSKSYTYEYLHCYSFIEKPFEADRVKQVVEQCLRFPGSVQVNKTLYFRKEGIVLAVERENIVYVESILRKMHIHTKRGDVLTIPYLTIKKFLEEADSSDMIQCSRNTVINRNYVLNVDITNRMIQFKDGLGSVEIGDLYKKSVKERFE